MKKTRIILFVVLGIVIIFSFFYYLKVLWNTETIYSGTYKNNNITVKMITKEGFVRNTFYHSVQLGDLKPINIDAFSTDNHGVPYDKSVFGNSKFTYIDTSFSYENEITYDPFKSVTMLYFSKKEFTMEEFLAYEEFFKNNWLQVQTKLLAQKNGYFTNIVGVVYGDREDFIKVFKGIYDHNFFNLTVYPDGEIVLSKESNIMELNNSGLSNKVQMPDKIILQKVNEIKYTPNYDTFKDKKGKNFKDYYRLIDK